MLLNVLVQPWAGLDFITGHIAHSNSSQDHFESEFHHPTGSHPHSVMSSFDKHVFWVFWTWPLIKTLNRTWFKADPRSPSELTLTQSSAGFGWRHATSYDYTECHYQPATGHHLIDQNVSCLGDQAFVIFISLAQEVVNKCRICAWISLRIQIHCYISW